MTNQWEIQQSYLLLLGLVRALDLLLISSRNIGDFRYFELVQATIVMTVRAENSGSVFHPELTRAY